MTLELSKFFADTRLQLAERFEFEPTFDTMGGPITVAVFEKDTLDDIQPVGSDSYPLLYPQRLYPDTLLKRPYWDDQYISQAMKLIAEWLYPIWKRTASGIHSSAIFLSYVCEANEQFNLQTGQWEALD